MLTCIFEIDSNSPMRIGSVKNFSGDRSSRTPGINGTGVKEGRREEGKEEKEEGEEGREEERGWDGR